MNLYPSTQKKLFEHRFIFQDLTKLYKEKKLPNKILLSGEKGIGKATLAYHLINFILHYFVIMMRIFKLKIGEIVR